jgi:hypothetical protein
MSFGDFLANAKHKNNVRNFDPIVADLNKRFPRRQPEPPYKGIWLDIITAFVIVVILGFVATKCHGQTISPAISECKGPKCRGEFTIRNDQIIPLAMFIEPQSVTTADGKILYLHLNSQTFVHLSASSGRLSPHQTVLIDYEITCAAMPCVVNFAATFTGLHSNGLLLALHLGNIVYICDKQKDCRSRIRANWKLQ